MPPYCLRSLTATQPLLPRWRGALWLLLLCAAGVSARAETAAPMATPAAREAVLKSLRQEEAQWKTRLEGPRPHLYFNGMNAEAIRERLKPGRAEVARFLKQVEPLETETLPPFLTPGEEVRLHKTPEAMAQAQNWQRKIGNRLVALCIAGLFDDSPALRAAIRRMTVGICRYPTWGFLSGVPNSDLSCAHLAVGVAMAWDWYPQLWPEDERSLILGAIRDRANGLLGAGYGKAYWYNTFDHNHNHVDAAALGICGAAFFNEIAEAPEWLAFARLNFQTVAKVLAADGSSPEGVSYWSYGLCFLLQYIEATRGVIDSADLYEAPFFKNTAAYRLHVSTSGFQSILPWGDAVYRDYSGPRQSLYRLADQYGDGTARWLAEKIGSRPDAYSPYINGFCMLWGAPFPAPESFAGPQTLDHYFPVGDIVTTRTGWGEGDYLLSLKSGFTNQAHTHLDAGALALAFGDEWLLTAPGYGKDAAGPGGYWDRKVRRWKFFAPSTESHSTLLIDGENQRFDMKARGTIDTFFSAPLWTWSEADLSQAYRKVSAVRRTVVHRRGEYIAVLDTVEAPKEISVEWLAQLGGEPRRTGNTLEVEGKKGTLRIAMLRPARPFEPRKPTVPNIDVPLEKIHTWSVRETGRSVAMAALLMPGFSGVPAPELTGTVRVLNEGRESVEITGPGWVDRIERGTAGKPVEIDEPGLRLTARSTAIRTKSKTIDSFVATGVTALRFAGAEFDSETPCDLAFQRTPQGAWVVDAGRAIAGTLELPKGLSLKAVASRSGNSISAEGACRYLLFENEAAFAEAIRWLDSPAEARPAPTPDAHEHDPSHESHPRP